MTIRQQQTDSKLHTRETGRLQDSLTRLRDQNEDLKSELRKAQETNLDRAARILEEQTRSTRRLLEQQKAVGAAMAHEVDRARHPLTRDISVRVALQLPGDVELTRQYVARVWDADWDEIWRHKELQPSLDRDGESALARALRSIYVHMFVFRGKLTASELEHRWTQHKLYLGVELQPQPDSDEELLRLARGCNIKGMPCWSFSFGEINIPKVRIFVESGVLNPPDLQVIDGTLVSLLDLYGSTVCVCLSVDEGRQQHWAGRVSGIQFTDATGWTVDVRKLSGLPDDSACQNGFIGYIPQLTR